jgi:hypothetical protein
VATWDSTYLLGYYKRLTGRTGTDAILDATKYQQLSEAQNEIVADLAAICPNVLYPTVAYGSLPTLTTTDSQVYTFGSDSNSFAKFPMGKGGIFQSLNDIPDSPLVPGVDYMIEGTQVRALNNGTLPATLYWYGISQPADIDATHQPAINPESARELIGIRAAYNFGTEGNRNPALSAAMAQRYGYPLTAAPGRFAFWCLTWKTQFRGGGAVSYTGMQLALGGAGNLQWAT